MSFRMRWWMWVVAGVLVLVTAVIAMRMHGFILLRDVEAELRRQGLPDLGEFLANAPPVDMDRQARIAKLIRGHGSWGDNPGVLPFAAYTEQRRSASDTAKLDSMLAAGAGTMAAVGAILDEGPVELSMFEWIERDPVRLASMSPEMIWNNQPSTLLAGRVWCNWFGIQACQAADPVPYLRQLDRAQATLLHPATLLDAMIGIAMHSIRDQVYSWLATRGRLPVEQLRAWTAEDPHHREWLQTALAGERLLYASKARNMTWRELCQAVDWSMTPGSSPGLSSRFKGTCAYVLLGHETAVGVSQIVALESLVHDKPAPAGAGMPLGIPSQIGTYTAGSEESLVTMFEAAFGHRLFRIMGMCAANYRSGTPLPDNTGALAARMPIDLFSARSDNEPAIVYERLSPTRFRLGLDPASTRPPIVPASRWTTTTTGTYGTTIGRPISSRAYEWSRWSLEIDLDAILIPPPEKPAKAKPK